MTLVLTVTLNAAVDKTYTVPGFSLNCVHRPANTFVIAGGKGINVARAYKTLGGDALATGFLGGRNGDYIRETITAEGIAHRFVTVAEESRLCIAIMDPLTGFQTELNEIGPHVTTSDCETFLVMLWELLPQAAFLILSGSVPPGAPTTIYRDITRIAQDEFGVKTVLDTSGEPLVEGILSKPFLAKPNYSEVAALGIHTDDWRDSAAVLRERYGLPMTLVTAGARGAVVANADGVWHAAPPPIELKSAVGSGDALTAGFLRGLGQGKDVDEALRLGVAAGAVNAATFGAGVISREEVNDLAGFVVINKIG